MTTNRKNEVFLEYKYAYDGCIRVSMTATVSPETVRVLSQVIVLVSPVIARYQERRCKYNS